MWDVVTKRRWWRCASQRRRLAGRDDENDDTEEKEEEETMVGVTDICQVCLEMTKKKKNRRGQKYMEMEKNGQLVLIKDLSAALVKRKRLARDVLLLFL